MLNKSIIMGRMTHNPELRRTQSGTAVASFTLAVERDFADKSTGKREADFINVVAWRNTAEFVERYFSRGRMAIVEGRIQTRKYKDRDGNDRTATEIVAENVYFGDSKRDADGEKPAQRAQNSAQGQNYGAGAKLAEIEDEDGELPF